MVTGLQAVNASQVQYSYHVTMATTACLRCLGQLFKFFWFYKWMWFMTVHDCSFNWLTEFKLLLPFLLLAVSLHLQPLVESPAVILLLWTFWLRRNGVNWKELCFSCKEVLSTKSCTLFPKPRKLKSLLELKVLYSWLVLFFTPWGKMGLVNH